MRRNETECTVLALVTAEGFEGFPATWFYLDRHAGTLSETVPAGTFAPSQTVTVSIAPRYFNAPQQALGANQQTQFLQQGKPSAYLKVQLDQDQAGTSTKPLTFAAMYPIVDNPNDDIGSVFFSDPAADAPIANVPLPGGTGQFRTAIAAIVGGTRPKSSLTNIIGEVLNFAGGPGVTALFPVPAADLVLASNVEALLAGAATAFAPETKQQFWINNNAIPVAANAASAQNADSDTLQLVSGTNVFVVFPAGPGDAVENAVRTISAQPGTTFDVDRGGALRALKNGTPLDPNPFANLIYVTYRATVHESS
jgi:hypothetical protein